MGTLDRDKIKAKLSKYLACSGKSTKKQHYLSIFLHVMLTFSDASERGVHAVVKIKFDNLTSEHFQDAVT